jgi:hypothetical protein
LDQTISSVKEVGIDYITATTMARYSDSGLDSFGRFIVDEQIHAGERERPFRFSGYVGRSAGSATYGRRPDGGLVRLSGATAGEHWEQCVALASNVSRLDLQATIRPDDGPTERLRKHYSQVRRQPKQRGRPSSFKLWVGPGGPESLMLGARASDRYGRIYDKGLESRVAEYEGMLRYELELKGGLSFRMACELASSPSQRSLVVQELLRFFKVRAMRVPELESQANYLRGDMPSSLVVSASVDRRATRLRWLRNSVEPCVRELVAAGMLDQVLTALNLDQLVELSEKVPDVVWSNSIGGV